MSHKPTRIHSTSNLPDGKTGDGAGIHIEIPKDFFIEKIEITGHRHDDSDLCVGMIFLPRND